MTEVEIAAVGKAKRHLLAHRGKECEECREARMTLRRFSPLTEEQREESYRMAVDAAYSLGYKAGFDAATDDIASVEGAHDVGEDEDCAWCGHPKGHHHEFVRSGVTGLLARSEDHAYASTPSAPPGPDWKHIADLLYEGFAQENPSLQDTAIALYDEATDTEPREDV